LGTLGGSNSAATAVNGVGQVVGGSATASGASHAFLWQSGAMTDLGTLGGSGSLAEGINASGQVVGDSGTPSGATHAFLWQNGAMTDLGTLGGSYSRAYGINGTGQVVGESTTSSGATHAFRWQNGTMTDLGVPTNGTGSSGWAINTSGQVAGGAGFRKGNNAYGHAVLWQSGRWTDLGTIDSTPLANSTAYALNDSGRVVGASDSSAGRHAFVWQSKVGMTDLNTLIPAGSGWTLYYAYGINTNGQIVGSGNQGGRGLGYLLTPTAVTASTSMMASPGAATISTASSSTSIGLTMTGSDSSGSLLQGPLGVIPDTSTWAAAPRFTAHRRPATGLWTS
jgi:probable HAF family extracellular repeat protein